MEITMTHMIEAVLVGGVVALALSGSAGDASAQGSVSLMGGVHAMNQNDTAFPDRLVTVPLVGSVAYDLSPVFAVEVRLSWPIPVEQDVTLSSGATAKMKSP